ncbi:hypothetical protein POSPLADRAFT_1053156 [Postia placenta MAD-698-R-SB12]|uniref:Uncharacterized protein n=1 Tax=Postia placenta MAD-698-R-SB12 TaxID=670580 RepID=A0A1X6NCZ8_9APHY|nr:hypothetical protein POSPLADRAFT_1053156 [Postia placenta MAD-698-R-SB12]OSX66519.1 hypothetical protein POSPLADRAFT_1053156 [Postia placenta MAD-698-R-SB12]
MSPSLRARAAAPAPSHSLLQSAGRVAIVPPATRELRARTSPPGLPVRRARVFPALAHQRRTPAQRPRRRQNACVSHARDADTPWQRMRRAGGAPGRKILDAQHGVRAPCRWTPQPRVARTAMTAGPGSASPDVHARPREAGAPQQSPLHASPVASETTARRSVHGRGRAFRTSRGRGVRLASPRRLPPSDQTRRAPAHGDPRTDAPPRSSGRNAPASSATLIASVASHAASPHHQCRTRAFSYSRRSRACHHGSRHPALRDRRLGFSRMRPTRRPSLRRTPTCRRLAMSSRELALPAL